MVDDLFFSNSRWSHLQLRKELEQRINSRRLYAAIDADPAIVGAGVVYIDADYRVVVLREFQSICSLVRKNVILREAPRSVGRVEFTRRLEQETRESKLASEIFKTALACGAAAISWLVVIGGFGSAPFTGGASGGIAVIGVPVAIAGTVQCGVGFIQAHNELVNPALNDYLDSDAWYQTMMIGLDTVSLLGVGSSALSTVRMVKTIQKTTGKNAHQVLKGLSRQQRANLTRELLSIRHPEMTRKMIKLKQMAGEMPKRYTAEQIRHGTLLQIKDALGAVLAVSSSAMYGGLNALAIGFYEEIPQ